MQWLDWYCSIIVYALCLGEMLINEYESMQCVGLGRVKDRDHCSTFYLCSPVPVSFITAPVV